jgi:hypothetical protein
MIEAQTEHKRQHKPEDFECWGDEISFLSDMLRDVAIDRVLDVPADCPDGYEQPGAFMAWWAANWGSTVPLKPYTPEPGELPAQLEDDDLPF